ncbi:MAG: hypothetical protein K6T77_04970 [candidate division WOR-3 bacterium]|nr:hypothetical protein [candidate division WOR-3 bacterium]MCR4424082.1 hypothetical protein [candidate division WOR-3 bacterium]MDH7519499.1 hypothetical protein [bacterium]
MALTIHQKSVYLMVYNATLISRSIGKKFAGENNETRKLKLEKIRKCVFEQIEDLTTRMDRNKLTENDIIKSIDNLSTKLGISFGQAQKPINVILKYHFYLTRNNDARIKRRLHCPIDSFIQQKLGKSRTSLTKISKENYLEMQKIIGEKSKNRIDFDTQWDERYLKKWGLL